MAYQYAPTSPSPTLDNWRTNNNRSHSPTPTPSGTNTPTSNKLPGYGLSQHHHHHHQQSQPSQARLSPFFNERRTRTLPMYKDKPYFAPRRTGPRSRRRKTVYAGLCVFVVTLLWRYMYGPVSWSGFGVRGPDWAKGGELYEWMLTLKGEGESGAAAAAGSGSESGSGSGKMLVDWEARREKVRDAMIVSWDGYEQFAWGYDEYHPLTKRGKNLGDIGMGWIIVDALDTLILMNLTTRVQNARNWIHTSLNYGQQNSVSTFETTIRMLGGLLSAHYLSTKYPGLAPQLDDDKGAPGEDLYIEHATDLADRLLGAFDTPSGVPLASVNLNSSQGIESHLQNGASSTSEATSLQLEFKYLAKLTGEGEYWQTVEKVMQVVEAQKMQDGLVPIYIYPSTGRFRESIIGLGSRGDSYYEYLIKQHLQTSEPIYKEMWNEALTGIRKHLITYSKRGKLTVLAERPKGLEGPLNPKMDHLACFLPGSIALGATGGLPLHVAKQSASWTRQQDEEMLLAQELTKTCWASYRFMRTGLAPEITYFQTDKPAKTMADMYPPGQTKLESVSDSLDSDDRSQWGWREDVQIHRQDRHNLQRPETVESLFYMYRITGDEMYREWGWEIFKAFVKHTAVVDFDYHHRRASSPDDDGPDASTRTNGRIVGFTSLDNAHVVPPLRRDSMEGFWMSETLKYLYLLFSDREFVSLEDHVFNTEAHVFPRFQPGGDLKTGWTRAHTG